MNCIILWLKGQLNMMEFSKSLREYMGEKNNISERKLMNIQKVYGKIWTRCIRFRKSNEVFWY